MLLFALKFDWDISDFSYRVFVSRPIASSSSYLSSHSNGEEIRFFRTRSRHLANTINVYVSAIRWKSVGVRWLSTPNIGDTPFPVVLDNRRTDVKPTTVCDSGRNQLSLSMSQIKWTSIIMTFFRVILASLDLQFPFHCHFSISLSRFTLMIHIPLRTVFQRFPMHHITSEVKREFPIDELNPQHWNLHRYPFQCNSPILRGTISQTDVISLNVGQI
jgi:hypothetical protein